ncbi:hypothetical protein ONE63_006441 [Megalurothrips usitatus]|uniref:Uncharacterized protein n=1 Tax=Megalurothrips usitatus TaxID=439358 RepID=A0AAV7XXD8_9NEOP|nr:hypothetical protein ONE63_006441 [Megalurothrips usitatus]
MTEFARQGPPRAPGSGLGPGSGAPALVLRRPPGTGGGRLLNGVARVSPVRVSPVPASGRLSAAASLPLLLQDPQSDAEEDAPSLSNILDAVQGLEVADDEGGDAPARSRRPPTPPPRTTPTTPTTPTSPRGDLYYCKPWPPLEGRPGLRRTTARTSPRQGPRRRADVALPPPPRLPDQFDEKQYLENRQLRRRSYHQLEDGGCPLQQWTSYLEKAPAAPARPRVPPVRSQSLRTPRPPPYVVRQVRAAHHAGP